jgi:hypothetical protein
MELGQWILVLINTIVISSFILYAVIKNAIDNSVIGKKLDYIEIQISEVKQLLKKDNENKS